MATKSQNLGMFIGLSAQWKPFVSVRILVSNKPFDEFRIAWRTKMSDMSLRTKGCVLDVSLGARPGLRTIIYSSATLHRCAIFASISWNFSRKAVASKRHGAWQIWNSSKFCKFSAIPNQWCIGKNIQVNIESVPNQNDKWELCCYWNSCNFQCLNMSAIQCPMSSQNFGIRAGRGCACCAPPCYSKLVRNTSIEDLLAGGSNPFEYTSRIGSFPRY